MIAVVVVGAILGAAAIGAAMDGDRDGTAAADPTDRPAATEAAAVSPTPRPTERSTPRPTERSTERLAPTVEPTPEVTLDPDTLFGIWRMSFAGTADEFLEILAPAIEADYYWIDSIDRTAYDDARNELRLDASILFESVYRSDPAEWRSDTWELFRDYGRIVWGPFKETFEEDLEFAADWPRWTPGLTLVGNAGRLTVECPGAVIHGIAEREVTQADFQSRCSFRP